MKRYLQLTILTILLLTPILASAQIPSQIVPACATTGATTDIGCFLELFINIANLIFGISGSVALVIFIIGGIQYLLAAGYPEKVQKAHQTLKNALIGLAIIFGAFAIINVLVYFVTGGANQGKTLEQIAPSVQQYLPED